MNKTIITVVLTLISFSCIKSQHWKHNRYSMVFGVGTTHFMGDLGGGAKDAAHFFGIRDVDMVATRPLLSAAFRMRITETIAAKAGLSWAVLAADDKNSTSPGRKSRNLHFRTNLFSINLHGEYYFLKERVNPRYLHSYRHSWRNFSAYVFSGISFNLFNPKAKLDGKWHALQPLGTEGQGIDDNPQPYKRHAFGLPLGLGVKYFVSRRITLGVELSNTYTSSDYIDDVHGSYFDNGKIRSKYGEVAARLADRHLDYEGNPHTVPKPSGSTIRGNTKYNDAFILAVFTLTYTLKRDNRGLPKFF